MKYLNKSFTVPVDDSNYERIFGHTGPIKDGGGIYTPIKTTDGNGKEVVLTVRQKNNLYSQARWMREKIKDHLCTPTECDIPSDHNVNKMLKSEFAVKPMVENYKKIMKVLGADPKEIDVKRLRRK